MTQRRSATAKSNAARIAPGTLPTCEAADVDVPSGRAWVGTAAEGKVKAEEVKSDGECTALPLVSTPVARGPRIRADAASRRLAFY